MVQVRSARSFILLFYLPCTIYIIFRDESQKKAEFIMLTEKQLSFYRENGYVIPDYRLPDSILCEISDAHNHLIEHQPQFIDFCSTLLASDMCFLNFARNTEILNCVSQLLGDDIILWNESFFSKPAKTGSTTPWHQDGEYWPIRPLATCTVWIAVDDSNIENGCLRVIPGSHKNKRLLEHELNEDPDLSLPLELKKSEFDEKQAHDIILEAGQMSIHDVYLAHGSKANRSNKSRRGLTLRFMPATSVYDRDIERQNRQNGTSTAPERSLFLMRGIDRSGNNDFRVRI